MPVISKSVTLPNGKEIHIETGRLARQADGAVMLRCGDTMLLATVCASQKSNTEIDYLPLSVDYMEKYASTGKIPGGFFKREGRLGENEILVSRLVDRALRPLFPEDYHADMQVIIMLVSSDKSEQADALACLAASAAVCVSDIPFSDPVCEVRVSLKEGVYTVNPTYAEMEGSIMDIMVAGTDDSIVMVEGEMKEVSEEQLLEGMMKGHEYIKILNKLQAELRAAVANPTREYDKPTVNQELLVRCKELMYAPIREVVYGLLPKKMRMSKFQQILDQSIATVVAEYEARTDLTSKELKKLMDGLEKRIVWNFQNLQYDVMRAMVLDDGKRLDGRKGDDIRAIWSETGTLPRAHGSAIFTRGETQALCSVTLGTKLDEQKLDTATLNGVRRFLMHYNFPPFSTGEVKPMRGPARREVGHGNLAERALKGLIPENYEYTVRVVSDVLESNGSSSMATVCGSCLALMDAGVKIPAMVSGIAMGLVTNADVSKYAVLSDILGDEDHLGDMDFKVAGTRKGLTATQMDMKVRGLSFEILKSALEQSRRGRLHILEEMEKTMTEPRTELSPYAPRITSIDLPIDMIGAVIGPGGKIVQEIQRSTGVTIVIEEVPGKGIATVYAMDKPSMDAAVTKIRNIVAMPEVGGVYPAKVKSIKEFGAFVEFMPGKEGLLHISEIAWERLPTMDGVLEVGDEFDIKLIGVDEKTGKFRLSRKVLLPVPEGMEVNTEDRPRKPHSGGPREGGHKRFDKKRD
jgi:polyribonucleotide nucleotidyltransferase